jgi:hypothetical protein
MTEARRLLEKYRNGAILVDSNLLLLLLIGKTNERRIERFSRTQMYTLENLRLLRDFVRQFRKIVTTPHVLTEVSNLAKIGSDELASMRAEFRLLVAGIQEVFEPSREIMATSAFMRLGLADAAIRLIATESILVLTDDLPLYHLLSTSGIDAINFRY